MIFRFVHAAALLIFAVTPAAAQIPSVAEGIIPTIVRRDDLPLSTIQNDALAAPFASVGAISSGNGFGSGTLITSRLMLTAAHVVGATPLASYTVTFGSTTYTATQAFVHPDYVSFNSSIGTGNDIAILMLSTDVVGINPATLNTNTNELGIVGVNVGYGNRGIGSNGQGVGPGGVSEPFGIKAAGENVVDAFGNYYSNVSSKFMLQDFDNPLDTSQNRMGSPFALAKESLIGQGDSGGGLFQDFGNGYVLSGVHSFLDDFTSNGVLADYGDVAGSVRVSQQLAFINGTIATVTPEPGTFTLILPTAIIALCLVRRRTRH